MSGPLLVVRGLSVSLGGNEVLAGVSFELDPQERLGLVGESGAGKSTLARAVIGLVPVSDGTITFAGRDLTALRGASLRALRPDLQMIFQHPIASLDPRMTIGESIDEVLRLIRPKLDRRQRAVRLGALLGRVGLDARVALRHPRELSGGECQRAAIARALVPNPRLLVCDEPVSALDVSIQGQIVNLLADVNAQEGTALLLISHNLHVVRSLCRRVLVLLHGRLLEVAPTERLFESPLHPYTRALLEAMPVLQPDGISRAAAQPPAPPRRDRPSAPHERGRGCVFRERCTHAIDACAEASPVLEPVAAGHAVACLRWRDWCRAAP